MSGRCIDNLPHSCGSSDGLQVFEKDDGKHDGFCFVCRTYVSDPYDESKGKAPKKQRKQKSEEEKQAEFKAVAGLPTVVLPSRKLNKGTLEHFGVKVALSETDGSTPELVYYPYYKRGKLSAYRVRLMEPKKFWMMGDTEGLELWGWQQALASGARVLYITEGENDCMALYQALMAKQKGTEYENYLPAVVSLTGGSGSARKNLSDWAHEIKSRFKEVVLVFDMDEAGRKAVDDGLVAYPSARSASIPAKDPNQCVIEGRSLALANSVLFQASVPKNTSIIWADNLYSQARQQASMGLSWPWDGLTRLTRGIRFGETIYLGAGVKMGKSELVNAIGAHLITEHGLKVFMAKPEEANVKSVKMLLSKVAGKIFHDPEIEFDSAAYDAAASRVGNKLALLDLYQHMGWDSLRSDIMVAAEGGCKAVFIDPITNLTNGTEAGQANTKLQEVAQELAALSKDLDIVTFIFCHLKSPETGPSHERGGKVLSHQFAGSRAMMRSCNMMLGLEGDKDPDLTDEERNMRKLVLLEDREFGASGYINLFWNKHTGIFSELK